MRAGIREEFGSREELECTVKSIQVKETLLLLGLRKCHRCLSTNDHKQIYHLHCIIETYVRINLITHR